VRQLWLDRLLDAVADRGRDLLHPHGGRGSRQSVDELCRRLLAGHGEASAIALARDILRRYQGMDHGTRAEFFHTLLRDFGPDPQQIRECADRYLASPNDGHALMRLVQVVEPPRQELFRRLNMAPRGTASLVAMRADLLRLLGDHPVLLAVDADLRHLLASWFNRGFLRLERIDWRTPAQVLEKLIQYESVHEIKGWNDLRRRLAPDRRCFAFFHPALPDEPLIFVEVALSREVAAEIGPLISQDAPVQDVHDTDTAVFYSINNAQEGLRGISFGNFLIKQVLTELRTELPHLRTFVTLSPMPRFTQTIEEMLSGRSDLGVNRAQLDQVLQDDMRDVMVPDGDGPLASLAVLAEKMDRPDPRLYPPMRHVALAYLTLMRCGGDICDPVAAFHLANGASLECINPFADVSVHGRAQSFGCMVNYRYEPDRLEENHEAYINESRIVMSKTVARDLDGLKDRIGSRTG
jgi:malonyl-CoA decarboxylase